MRMARRSARPRLALAFIRGVSEISCTSDSKASFELRLVVVGVVGVEIDHRGPAVVSHAIDSYAPPTRSRRDHHIGRRRHVAQFFKQIFDSHCLTCVGDSVSPLVVPPRSRRPPRRQPSTATRPSRDSVSREPMSPEESPLEPSRGAPGNRPTPRRPRRRTEASSAHSRSSGRLSESSRSISSAF